MSVKLDNLKALINGLMDDDKIEVVYLYSPVNPCGIIGFKVDLHRTIYLTKRDDEQVLDAERGKELRDV